MAGLDEHGQPFLSAFDLVGAACYAEDFVVGGTSSEQLYGVCESFWRENMVRLFLLNHTLEICDVINYLMFT